MLAAEKSYWNVFREKPEIVDSIIAPVQRDLVPFLKRMLTPTAKQREGSRYSVGFPVTLEAILQVGGHSANTRPATLSQAVERTAIGM